MPGYVLCAKANEPYRGFLQTISSKCQKRKGEQHYGKKTIRTNPGWQHDTEKQNYVSSADYRL